MKYILITIVSTFPHLSFAAEPTLQILGKNIFTFANNTLLPLIVGIAFLFLIINTVRYFIFQGASEDGREQAKTLALYGVFAFVLLVIFWGIVNLLANTIGLNTKEAPTSDYISRAGSTPGPTVATTVGEPIGSTVTDTPPVVDTTPPETTTTTAPPVINPPLSDPPPVAPPVDNSRVATAVTGVFGELADDQFGAPGAQTLGAVDTILSLDTTSINDATANERTVIAIKELEAAGLATSAQANRVIAQVNEQRASNGQTPIDPTRVTIDPAKVNAAKAVIEAQQNIASAIIEAAPTPEAASEANVALLTALQAGNIAEARAAAASVGAVTDAGDFSVIAENIGN